MNDQKKKLVILGGALIVIVVVFVVYMSFFREYTVTFTLKVSAGIESKQVKKNELVEEPKVPTVDGYVFKGWYLDGELYDFSRPVTKNIDLEAKWEKVAEHDN